MIVERFEESVKVTQNDHLRLKPLPGSCQAHQQRKPVNSWNCQLGRKTGLEIGKSGQQLLIQAGKPGSAFLDFQHDLVQVELAKMMEICYLLN